MSEPSSPTSQTASAFYDPDSSCWRTSQGSLLSEEYPLLERLPGWGTTAAGALCEQATPEHLTNVRAGSALLATPTASEYPMGDAARWHDPERSNELSDQMAALLPTPTTVDAKVFGPNVDWQLRLSNHAPHTASVLMNLPSNDGNGSSDDQHPPQPMIEDSDPSSSNG